ncbi:hypothetical protein SASPL_131841 [Salvia splendens]|uniref:Uncharacterized protein n=1 Tax=Salvia splendens TaxID=180675 RepID=A0A4D8Z7W5_SALSN|nr:uncharacterized protein LOC121755338 isoform X1 [Salvia splendens]XP_042007338.1 uncharacterized protein LOC121755954 isoform X1 [Salvia splendens]KAG6408769.1 hypothetical protein SASPL_131792 [Salvia splendens]KAG6408816.1 hypothetical protein SASPL_131841 [Salvia splendens]
MESPTATERRPRRLSRYRELVEDKYGLLSPYRRKFVFEDKETFDYKGWYDSDEEDDVDLQITDVHGTIKRFLQQVRDSGGYDLDCCPPSWFHVPFRPIDLAAAKQNDEAFYKEVIKAAHFAIREINAEMTDKCYEFVEVERVVLTSTWTKLLTFSAKEEVMRNACADFESDSEVEGDASIKTIQAMVHECFDDSLELEQWRFKPLPVNSMEVSVLCPTSN